MSPTQRSRLLLGVFAFTIAASIIPLALQPLPTLYAKVFMGVFLGVLIPSVVVAVARDVDFETVGLKRFYGPFVVVMAVGFAAIAALTPPDPAAQLRPLLATVGIATATGLAVVAFDVDRRIAGRV